jgi:hypothetical protein
LRYHKEFNFWDVGKKATPYLSPGNKIAIICETYVYLGEIIEIIKDESGLLGDTLGWTRQFKNPSQNVIVLKKIRETDQAGEEFKKFPAYFEKAKKLERGFFSLEGEKEQYFYKLLGGVKKKNKKGIKIKKEQAVVLPIWLNDLVQSIKNLKNDRNHYEREHESLVQKFFESIGYKLHDNIKYRQGRVDILINLNKIPCIVVEVKRYWNLTKNDEEVIFQAYKYALKNGARFVVLTNGDNYIIFDRLRGLSIEQNYLGSFRLTHLTEKSLQLIEFLRKEHIEKIITHTEIMKIILSYL